MTLGAPRFAVWSSAERVAAPPAELIAFGHFSKRSQERHDRLVPFEVWRAWSATLREYVGGIGPSYCVLRHGAERYAVIFDGTYVATTLPAKRLRRPAPVDYPSCPTG